MKALRFLRALPLALTLFAAPVGAEQGTIVGPVTGPHTMADVMGTLNAAFLAIQTCNSGTSAPANGTAGAAVHYQCWADTSGSPTIVYKTYDGASWVAFGKLNTTTHVWTPVYQGTDLSTASTATTGTSGHTVPFLDGANTWSGVQSFNSGKLALNGSTSGAGTLNAPAAASAYVWTLPAATDTLVGKATTDTFTNKTFDTAGAGNSFSINGLAATANTGTGFVVRATSPTLVTPNIGAATGVSLALSATTASASTATGALTVAGGAGVGGAVNAGDVIASSVSTAAGNGASFQFFASNANSVSGRAGVAIQNTNGGGQFLLQQSPSGGAFIQNNGTANVINWYDKAGNNYISMTGGAALANTQVAVKSTQASTSSATGALTVAGGVGVAGALNIGGAVNKVTITAPATGSTLTIPDGVTLTGPAASGTAATLANSETLTNKTFNCANNTCTVRLGSDATGTLLAANFPALTGDVTTSAGSLATAIGAGKVTNGMLAGSIAASKLIGTDIATVGTVTAGVWNGTKVGLAYGGTNADLSATGGASQVLKQVSTGAAVTVGPLAASDLSNGTTASGAVVLAARNIATGCGLAGGGDLTADRTIRLSLAINAQTGTSYTVQDSDCGKLVSLSNASAVAVSLPQANGSTFVSGWSVDFQNKGAGTVTVTPATSTINGGLSLALTQNQGMHCQSDGSNYTCMLGVGAGGGAGTVTSVATGDGLSGGTITASGTLAADASFFRGYLAGLTLSTAGSSGTFGIAAGVAVDSTNAGFMKLGSAYTKTTSAWAVGTASGALDTGTIANGTWYHVHLIKRLDTGIVDVLFSLSATSPTLPTNYTLFRRIGSMKTNGSAQWVSFVQTGRRFSWAAPVQDMNGMAITTTPTLYALSVPPGVKVRASVIATFLNTVTASTNALLYSPDEGTQAAGTPTGNASNLQQVTGTAMTPASLNTVTNSSAQVFVVAQHASGNLFYLITRGWDDDLN